MTIDELRAALDALGVRLEAVGGKLRIDAPAGVLTDELRAGLGTHKAALLADLGGDSAPGAPGAPGAPSAPGGVGTVFRIPLEWCSSPSEWAALHGMRVVGYAPDAGRFLLADQP